MRLSLRVFLPATFAAFFLIAGAAVVAGTSYYSYNAAVDRAIAQHETNLRTLKSTLYNDLVYYRAISMLPALPETFVREFGKSPGVVFLRTVQPRTQQVLVSTNPKEIGSRLEDLPEFRQEVDMRQGTWQGEEVLEFSVQGVIGENLWMGVSLSSIQEEALRRVLLTGLGAGIVLALLLLALQVLVRKKVLDPLFLLQRFFQKVGEGKLSFRMPKGPRNEIGDMYRSFNTMASDLQHSQEELEEARTVLEIKVRARTRELQTLADSLEEKVQERTRTMEEKVKELERFRKLAVGRELKMVELKKEIKQLRSRLREEGEEPSAPEAEEQQP